MGDEQRDYREFVTVNSATQEYVTLVGGKMPSFARVIHSDEEYGRALSSLVVACVDLFVVDDLDNVLLGTRQHKPQADAWLFGGRMVAGQTYYQTALTNARRELGVDLDLKRLSTNEVGHYSLVWDQRQQPPQDLGCHTISHVYAYRAAEGEFALDRHNGEYSGLRWVPKREILQDDGHRYHPLLSQVIEDFRRYVLTQRSSLRRPGGCI